MMADKIIFKHGLKGSDFKLFSDSLLKANVEQLHFLTRSINAELDKREQINI